MTESASPLQTVGVQSVASAPLDTNRFESLYREHAGYVLFSLRRLGVHERDLEDLAHELFIVVARKLDEHDPSRPLRPWLFGIAFRVALDYRRSARFRREQLDNDDAEPVDVSPGADQLMEVAEKQRLVHRALDTLRMEQRAVFVLHDLDGTKVPEIATALGIPLNTAYSRLRLAREQFASAVRELARGGR